MIFKGSYANEDLSNGCCTVNFDPSITAINYILKYIEILSPNNISQYYCFTVVNNAM